jgi:hypothetical protein
MVRVPVFLCVKMLINKEKPIRLVGKAPEDDYDCKTLHKMENDCRTLINGVKGWEIRC